MTNEEILREINSLPLEAQRQIEDFVRFLRQRYESSSPKISADSELEAENFVGIWQDREDMSNSTAWTRDVREKHWKE